MDEAIDIGKGFVVASASHFFPFFFVTLFEITDSRRHFALPPLTPPIEDGHDTPRLQLRFIAATLEVSRNSFSFLRFRQIFSICHASRAVSRAFSRSGFSKMTALCLRFWHEAFADCAFRWPQKPAAAAHEPAA